MSSSATLAKDLTKSTNQSINSTEQKAASTERYIGFKQTGPVNTRLRTVFETEDKVDVEKRIKAAQLPIKRIADPKILERSEDQGDSIIRMPTRPAWNFSDSTWQIESRENAAFADWLNELRSRPDYADINHYEQNLEVWRQLWRVIEMSDVLLLTVDVRFASLHFPTSLYNYACRDLGKPIIIILNKIDLVPRKVAFSWKQYFETMYTNVHCVFFTSKPQDVTVTNESTTSLLKQRKLPRKRKELFRKLRGYGINAIYRTISNLDIVKKKAESNPSLKEELQAAHTYQVYETVNLGKDPEYAKPIPKKKGKRRGSRRPMTKPLVEETPVAENTQIVESSEDETSESSDLDPSEMEIQDGDVEDVENPLENSSLKEAATDALVDENQQLKSSKLDAYIQSLKEEITEDRQHLVTLGLIGNPNTGKSSTLNSLVGKTVTRVSRTPGKTKHFQTYFVSKSIRLCDSPGLVFPSSRTTKSLQIISGVYPLSQLREPYSAVQYVAENVVVPLDQQYKLRPESDKQALSAFGLCDLYALKHGLLIARNGRPDAFSAGRAILRHVNDGRIFFTFYPPGYHDGVWNEPDSELDLDMVNYAQIMQLSKLYDEEVEKSMESVQRDSSDGEQQKQKPKGSKSGAVGNMFHLLQIEDDDEDD
eukprot:TRINITY_DN7554_c0_g1_i2.p1 TRINITY_DN7554_c0_g1~~TRINITY_DN7554_c0_g1_i2.p1  ORF type:complete len:651 (+),score=134.29 TRINITY_DN7554_c0_g1_i2:285-2237(+)